METTLYNLIPAIGWSMLHAIWLGAVSYITICCIQLLKPKLAAATKYNIAFGLQIIVFSGFLISFIYYYSQSKATNGHIEIEPGQLLTYFTAQQEAQFTLENLFPYLTAAYIVGLTFQILSLGNSYVQLRKLKYRGLESIPTEWIELFLQAKEKLSMQKRVSLFLSNQIAVPLTVGFFRPFVLFPIAYVNKLNIDQVETILIHELAHIKRRDYLFNLLKVVIETCLFFNPFVWAISKIVDREREHACDDLVIQHIENPLPYAKALLELEELRMNLVPALSMAATGKKNHLFQRIKRITRMDANPKNVKQQLIAVLGSVLAIFMLAFFVPAQDIQAEENVIIPGHPVFEHPAAPEAILIHPKDTIIPERFKIIPPVHPDTALLVKSIKSTALALKNDVKNFQINFDSPEIEIKLKNLQEAANKIAYEYKTKGWENHINEANTLQINLNKELKAISWGAAAKDAKLYFKSQEWKDQLKNIEDQAKSAGQYFEGKEWKDQLAKIEEDNSKVQIYFNSPEFKTKVDKIAANGKDVEIHYQGKELKQLLEEEDALYNSKEYKDLEKRHQKEMEALRKKLRAASSK